MRFFLFVTELGLLVLDEDLNPTSKFRFDDADRVRIFLDAISGTMTEDQLSWLRESIKEGSELFAVSAMLPTLSKYELKSSALDQSLGSEIENKKIDLLVNSGLASRAEEAQDAIRNVSLGISNLRIREMSAKPDLQAMESVQALDELDKTANIMSSRIREWYGLHFPELTSMTDDNASLIKLVLKFKSRENYDQGELENMGYSKNKSQAIVTAASQSRGAELREEDISRIAQLSEEALHLFSLRDKLASHVERTMRQIAPNVSEVAGTSIGARLIAKAGGLEKLAVMPASTIQILGAERALYRALKSGSRPPKHGILFQHAAVHSAPKWQRGKIARSVAGKIAIAARVDAYRGSKEESLNRALLQRLDEIKIKYKEAPKPKSRYVSQLRSSEQIKRTEGRGREARRRQDKLKHR